MRTFTPLKDRILWYDGDITFTPDQLYDFILRGGCITPGIHVDALNAEVTTYNQLNPSMKVSVKEKLDVIDQTWNIPDHYKNINIGKYVTEKLTEELTKQKFDEPQTKKRIDRVEFELKKYKEYDMSIVLKTIIYIVDEFTKNNVVWGTGRGSSCASYILYLLGLHNVDSVAYDLDVNDFFN
jgi:DNA polymerase III alpha subunit